MEELRAALVSVLGEERAHIAAPSGSCLLLDPDHPTRQSWREEGARLEAEAGHMPRPEDDHAPYLAAEPGRREAVRQVAEEVADALRKDSYRAFGWLTREVKRQARETRTEAFHVPRYGETVAFAEALTADCPETPARLDALTGWRQRAEPSLAESRAMLLVDAPHARHLTTMPGAGTALFEGTSRLDRTLVAVEAREMKVLSAGGQHWAEETGGIAFDSRDYAALMERARSLNAKPHRPERLRGTVDDLLAGDERWALNRDRVEALLGRAAEVERARNALTQMDVTTSYFEERLQARQDCRQKEQEVLNEAAALRKDMPNHELAAHLGAAGFQQDAVRKTEEKICNRIAHDEERQAAQRMRRAGDCRCRRGTPQAWTAASVRAAGSCCRGAVPFRPMAAFGFAREELPALIPSSPRSEDAADAQIRDHHLLEQRGLARISHQGHGLRRVQAFDPPGAGSRGVTRLFRR